MVTPQPVRTYVAAIGGENYHPILYFTHRCSLTLLNVLVNVITCDNVKDIVNGMLPLLHG